MLGPLRVGPLFQDRGSRRLECVPRSPPLSGITVWSLVGDEQAYLKVWLERCAQESLSGVLVEAGPRLASALLAAGAADYLYAFVAPRTGDPESPSWYEGASLPAGRLRTSPSGEDALYQGYLG